MRGARQGPAVTDSHPYRIGGTLVLIAYLTTDAVNQDLAQRLAAAHAAEVLLPRLGEPLSADSVDAIAYDLDFLPREQRRGVLSVLSAGRAPYPVAVHSYCLEAGQRRALRKTGVLVTRRLGRRMFEKLCHKALLRQQPGRRLSLAEPA
jgi:hypothetical protein